MIPIHRLVTDELLQPFIEQIENCKEILISVREQNTVHLVVSGNSIQITGSFEVLFPETLKAAFRLVLEHTGSDGNSCVEIYDSTELSSKKFPEFEFSASEIELIFYPKEHLISYQEEDGTDHFVEIQEWPIQIDLQWLACAYPWLHTSIEYRKKHILNKYFYPEGVLDQLKLLTDGVHLLHAPIQLTISLDEMTVELAFAWCDLPGNVIGLFSNHEEMLITDHEVPALAIFAGAVGIVLRKIAKENLLSFNSDDVLDGLCLVLRIRQKQKFKRSVQKRSVNANSVVIPNKFRVELISLFSDWLLKHPGTATKILTRVNR